MKQKSIYKQLENGQQIKMKIDLTIKKSTEEENKIWFIVSITAKDKRYYAVRTDMLDGGLLKAIKMLVTDLKLNPDALSDEDRELVELILNPPPVDPEMTKVVTDYQKLLDVQGKE